MGKLFFQTYFPNCIKYVVGTSIKILSVQRYWTTVITRINVTCFLFWKVRKRWSNNEVSDNFFGSTRFDFRCFLLEFELFINYGTTNLIYFLFIKCVKILVLVSVGILKTVKGLEVKLASVLPYLQNILMDFNKTLYIRLWQVFIFNHQKLPESQKKLLFLSNYAILLQMSEQSLQSQNLMLK